MKKRDEEEEDETYFSARENLPGKAKTELKPVLTLQRASPTRPRRPLLSQERADLSDDTTDSSEDETLDEDGGGAGTPKCLSRPFFSSNYGVIRQKRERASLPKFGDATSVKFEHVQDVVVIEIEGRPRVQDKRSERLVKNEYRKWGVHQTLAKKDGGWLTFGKSNKPAQRIEPGSPIPDEPHYPTSVRLNVDNDKPDSQTLNGSLKPQPGPAEAECVRLARVIEDLSWAGGFKERPLPVNDIMGSEEYLTAEEKDKKRKARGKPSSKKVMPRKKKTFRSPRSKSSARTGCDTDSSGSDRAELNATKEEDAAAGPTIVVIVQGPRHKDTKRKRGSGSGGKAQK